MYPNITGFSFKVISPFVCLAALPVQFPSGLLTPSAGDIKNSQEIQKTWQLSQQVPASHARHIFFSIAKARKRLISSYQFICINTHKDPTQETQQITLLFTSGPRAGEHHPPPAQHNWALTHRGRLKHSAPCHAGSHASTEVINQCFAIMVMWDRAEGRKCEIKGAD